MFNNQGGRRFPLRAHSVESAGTSCVLFGIAADHNINIQRSKLAKPRAGSARPHKVRILCIDELIMGCTSSDPCGNAIAGDACPTLRNATPASYASVFRYEYKCKM